MLLYTHCRLLSKNVWVPYAITHSKSVRLLFLTTFFFTIIDRTAATLIWLPTAIWLANKSSQDSGMMIIQSGSCAKYWRSFVVALNCNRSEQESRLLLPMRMYDRTCDCVMRSSRGNMNKNYTTVISSFPNYSFPSSQLPFLFHRSKRRWSFWASRNRSLREKIHQGWR